MAIIIYFVISILIGYITYKFQQENFERQLEEYVSWMDCRAFWLILLFGILWPIVIPVWFIIWVLEKTLGKIIEQIKNKNK
jgi:hypothetical protein